MKVCSHQPSFLPWVGFWNKLAQCDVYVALTGVDFAVHDYQNRVKLESAWLTLPLDKSTKNGPLKDVRVRDTKASADSLTKTIRGKRYPYAYRLVPVIEYLNNPGTDKLWEINLATMARIAHLLDIDMEVHLDEHPSNPTISKTQNVLLHSGAAVTHEGGVYEEGFEYYAGAGALAYLNKLECGPMKVMVQGVHPGTPDETVLQLIARVEDPLLHVKTMATWSQL